MALADQWHLRATSKAGAGTRWQRGAFPSLSNSLISDLDPDKNIASDRCSRPARRLHQVEHVF